MKNELDEKIRNIKDRYIYADVANGEPPDLREICDEYEAPYAEVRKIWSKENWLAEYNLNNQIFQKEVALARKDAYKEQAIDLVATQNRFINESIDFYDTYFPRVVKLLEDRINLNGEFLMDTKDLIALVKLLLEVKKDVQKTLAEAQAQLGKGNNANTESSDIEALFKDHKTKLALLEAAQEKISVGVTNSPLDSKDKAKIFSQLDAR